MHWRSQRLGVWGRAAALLALLALGCAAAPAQPARAASDLLPDLTMAPLRDITVRREGERLLLRFTAEIVNLGDGPFELRGSRAAPGDELMTVIAQRVYDDAGGARERAVPGAVMEFAGDGHAHWHVHDLEHYELSPADAPDVLAAGAKQGFCFFDNNHAAPSLSGSPAQVQYPGCGAQADTSVTMGLSVGWGDIYGWYLPGQYIDVTDLPPGAYRLRAVANPDGWFEELSAANNDTAVTIIFDGASAWPYTARLMLPLVSGA